MIDMRSHVKHLTCLFFLSGAMAHGQESLEVSPYLGEMVNEYLSERALELFAERDVAIAALDTAEKISARQEYIRSQVREALGGFPERTPLNPKVTRTLERSDYRVEMLLYESLPGIYVTANVYVPKSGEPPYPAVLGVAGHSANRKASATYQHAWISMVKRGFLVLAFDPPGQGERSEYFDRDLGRSRVGIGVREHNLAGLQTLLTGSHFARYEMWDAIRGTDYLLTRPDVDPERLAVAGNSGDGTQAANLAIVEPRLSVVVSSCYMTSWKQLWFDPGPQDSEQDFAHFLERGFDFPDFAIAFASRPFQILSATQDFFPLEGARSTFEEARRVYEVLGESERVGFFEYDDGHGWSKPRREATYRWLERWLHDRVDDGVEPEIETELESDLYVTQTGQVSTSYPEAETVQSINRAEAERDYPKRTAARLENPGELRQLVSSRLMMRKDRSNPRVSHHGEVGRDGYRIEKIVLQTEKGIDVPALVLVPRDGRTQKPAVLYVNAAGKSVDSDIEALARAGHVVMAPDPRGIGESRPRSSAGGYNPL